jgi:hypothetical protein
MKNKSIIIILATVALIAGAVLVLPAFAQDTTPEEPEWGPPCYDPETGEYTPLNPDCDAAGSCLPGDGAAQSGRGEGYRRGQSCGGSCWGTS